MPKTHRCNAWRAHSFGPTIRLKYKCFNLTRSHWRRVDPGEAFLGAIEGIGIGRHRRARLIQALDLLARQAPADRAEIIAFMSQRYDVHSVTVGGPSFSG